MSDINQFNYLAAAYAISIGSIGFYIAWVTIDSLKLRKKIRVLKKD